MCVAEGEISRVGCPDPACVKDARSASEDEVCLILSAEQIERWRWLKEKYTLEQGEFILIAEAY